MSRPEGGALADLFGRALALDGTGRETLLDALARERPEAAAEIRALLEHHERAGAFLETPAVLETGAALARGGPMPERIGSYAILGLLGEGGMGVVYLARQESPSRTVALKVMRSALASPREQKRFEREAELLGRLSHRGIARIYEAGSADAGSGPQPFLAMEHVRGVALDLFVRERGLDLRARLALLADVCDAVEHAHREGVVHRDLKPGNVLVDGSSGTAEVKVLDFGVARACGASALSTTARTRAGQLVGTLPYMSPEQASGDPDAVDARSDVYALGVIAYELASGRLPHDLDGRTLIEAVHAIRDVDPAPLSALQRILRGDVETIVAKALEKDPARRYPSAGALGDDLRRWLSDRPVLARPPSRTYQLAKFARRHKALVGGLSAVFLALSAGLAVALWQNALLAAERDRVAEEQRNASAVASWFESLLAKANPWVGARDVRLAEVLEQGARELPEEVRASPAIEARIRSALGVTFENLGLLERAEEEIALALERSATAHGEGDARTLDALARRGRIAMVRGRLDEAERDLARAHGALARLRGEGDPLALDAADNLALCLQRLRRTDESERLMRRTLEQRRGLGPEHLSAALTTENNLGHLLLESGRTDEAILVLSRALESGRDLEGARHPNTLMKENNLARALVVGGRHGEAVPLLEELHAAAIDVLGREHPDAATCGMNLGVALTEVDRAGEAEPLLRSALALREAQLGPDHPATLTALNNLASALSKLGRAEEAVAYYERALPALERVLGRHDPRTDRTRANLALALLALGDAESAVGLLREVAEGFSGSLGAEHWETALVRANLGRALDLAGRGAEAERELAAAVTLLGRALGEDDPRTRSALGDLGLLQRRAGRSEGAR